MAFNLSKRSLQRLEGVHPDLVAIVKEAIQITQHDFGVSCGMRTLEEQKKLVQSGASQTLASRHLTGHAVDLFGSRQGKAIFDWPAIYIISDAMITAARGISTPLRLGGAWNCGDVCQSELDAEALSADYILHKKQTGGRAFLDGPHFELPKQSYPA